MLDAGFRYEDVPASSTIQLYPAPNTSVKVPCMVKNGHSERQLDGRNEILSKVGLQKDQKHRYSKIGS